MSEGSWLARRRQDKLRNRGGAGAVATVVAFDQRSAHTSSNDEGTFSETKRGYTLTLRVEPEGEEAFAAELTEKRWDEGRGIPRVGDCIAVLYDPNDRSTVTRDDSLEGRQAANRAQFPEGS